ncbi:MAG TPA: hypothetical protein VHL58_14100 [Thermoanaerobaculia bacterium]|nr:hypothetical protein [Thermoanaerobaculia bacterium]
MKSLSALIFAVVFSAASAAAQDNAVVSAQAVVPVIGSVPGVGNCEWRTDVALSNGVGRTVQVVLSMVGAPNEPFLLIELRPGETSLFTDIARQTFGVTGVLAPLVIETLGARSVSVGATAYAVRGNDISEPEVLPVMYRQSHPLMETLTPLTFNDTFRANVGMGNIGDVPVTFVIALQRIAGRNLATTKVQVGPRSLLHVSIQSLFPLLSEGDDVALVVQEPAAGAYVYGSVIANATNNARFVSGQ